MDKIKMGNFLADLRKSKDLSQVDLAEIIGVTYQAVSKWERGEAIPDITILEKLASFYNITIDEIIRGEALEVVNRSKTVEEKVAEETSFLEQRRAFGLWFGIAYFVLIILFGLCPFAETILTTINTTTVFSKNYFQIIFGSNYQTIHFFFLLQFLTCIGIVAFTMLFYVCTTRKAFRTLHNVRTLFIILNLASLVANLFFLRESTIGNILVFLTNLIFDILFIFLKPNRKSYIIMDFKK